MAHPPPFALVTGANGFIGRHLCQKLIIEGYQVNGLLLPDEAVHPHLPREVLIHRGRLEDRASLEALLPKPGIVFHLAARVLDYGKDKWFRSSILTGTENIWLACRSQATRFVFASSVAAMGVNRHLNQMDENEPPHLTGIPYGDYKFQAEVKLREWALRDKVAYSIFRPTNVTGPDSVWVREPLKRMKGVSGLPLIDGGQYDAALLSIHNLVEGILGCGTHPKAAGETFFFRDDWGISWQQYLTDIGGLAGIAPKGRIGYQLAWRLGGISEAACRPFGWQPPVTRLGVGLTGRDLRVSTDKARSLLGWSSRQTYQECLAEIRTWWESTGIFVKR